VVILARCGCGGGICNCHWVAGPGITIDGSGSTANPAVISAETSCEDVRACLSAGPGASYDPAAGVVSAKVSTQAGNNLTVQPDGSLFVPTGAATVSVGCGLSGDGSGSAPVTAKTSAWTHAVPVTQYGGTVACDTNGTLRGEPRALVVSLISSAPQLIQPGAYANVRFPYDGESADYASMHQATQPDGYVVTNWAVDDRSSLIWPAMRGWATVYAAAQFADESDATEYRSQFARDPLDLSTGLDTTATEHRAATVGGEFWTRTFGLVVNPGTPLSFRVSHNASTPQNLTLAEFKLVIQPMYE
jgi:hypothetical protein